MSEQEKLNSKKAQTGETRRDVFKLSAAVAAFGAAMGVSASTSAEGISLNFSKIKMEKKTPGVKNDDNARVAPAPAKGQQKSSSDFFITKRK